jgi:bacterioferritin-associated ferredoxin
MATGISIDRCVCFERSFVELKIRAQENKLDADGIARRYGCGSCCGLCRPYIERMLETGQTSFHEILPPRERST